MLCISVLSGATLISTSVDKELTSITFHTDKGDFILHHVRDCCESVRIYDIEGDILDLQNALCIEAYESTSYNESVEGEYSKTYTFYSIQTVKGYVWIRWVGESNGYYSESVDFERL